MITPNLRGRLGNQMFQYVLTRIIADKRGFNYFIPKERNANGQNISEFFDLDMGKIDGNIIYRYEENHNQDYDPNLFNINDFTLISGFFQTEKYLIGYEDVIKEWFKVTPDETCLELLKKYPIDEYCYIHFRGGDYKDMGHWYLPKEYYENAILEIKKIKPDLKFLVITDDIEDARMFFKDIDIISNSLMVDFTLLYTAKYCIIPNSSFSWWAAWLSNEKITIAPSRWINYNNVNSGFWPHDVASKKFTYV